MSGQLKPSWRWKVYNYSLICCDVTDSVRDCIKRLNVSIVRNQNKSLESLTMICSNLQRRTNVSKRTCWCGETHECHSKGCLFIPVVQYILFSNKVIVFRTAKDYADVQLFSLRTGCWPGAPSWHMALLHYQLVSPLPARFPGGSWTKSFNATMMVISGRLSKRLSTRADGCVLIQFTSWACVSSAVNSPGKYVASLKQNLWDNCQRAFPTWVLPLFQVSICIVMATAAIQ